MRKMRVLERKERVFRVKEKRSCAKMRRESASGHYIVPW